MGEPQTVVPDTELAEPALYSLPMDIRSEMSENIKTLNLHLIQKRLLPQRFIQRKKEITTGLRRDNKTEVSNTTEIRKLGPTNFDRKSDIQYNYALMQLPNAMSIDEIFYFIKQKDLSILDLDMFMSMVMAIEAKLNQRNAPRRWIYPLYCLEMFVDQKTGWTVIPSVGKRKDEAGYYHRNQDHRLAISQGSYIAIGVPPKVKHTMLHIP